MPAKLQLLASALALTLIPMSAMSGPAPAGGSIRATSMTPSMRNIAPHPIPSPPQAGTQRPGLGTMQRPDLSTRSVVTGSRIPVTSQRLPVTGNGADPDTVQPVSPVQDPPPRERPDLSHDTPADD